MKLRVLLAGVLTLCVAAALVVPAVAHHRAKTHVTINYSGDGFFGKVKSKRARCKRNRTVQVWHQLGSSPDRSKDEKFGSSDTSSDNGSWDDGNPGQAHGRFYARVKGTHRCKPAISETIHATNNP